MSANITKAEVIDNIVGKTGLSKTEARVAFDASIETIIDYVVAGNRIELRGFGIFNHKKRQPRMARNPKTGEEVRLDHKIIPTFKPSTEFQEKVDNALRNDS
jgi:DNA-binding protein HU-beta